MLLACCVLSGFEGVAMARSQYAIIVALVLATVVCGVNGLCTNEASFAYRMVHTLKDAPAFSTIKNSNPTLRNSGNPSSDFDSLVYALFGVFNQVINEYVRGRVRR